MSEWLPCLSHSARTARTAPAFSVLLFNRCREIERTHVRKKPLIARTSASLVNDDNAASLDDTTVKPSRASPLSDNQLTKLMMLWWWAYEPRKRWVAGGRLGQQPAVISFSWEDVCFGERFCIYAENVKQVHGARASAPERRNRT